MALPSRAPLYRLALTSPTQPLRVVEIPAMTRLILAHLTAPSRVCTRVRATRRYLVVRAVPEIASAILEWNRGPFFVPCIADDRASDKDRHEDRRRRNADDALTLHKSRAAMTQGSASRWQRYAGCGTQCPSRLDERGQRLQIHRRKSYARRTQVRRADDRPILISAVDQSTSSRKLGIVSSSLSKLPSLRPSDTLATPTMLFPWRSKPSMTGAEIVELAPAAFVPA